MSRKEGEPFWTWFWSRVRTYFLSGLLVVVPIAATILILLWVFNTIDNILQPVIKEIIRWVTSNPAYNGHITGLGFAVTIVLILIAGLIAGNYAGRKAIQVGDSLLKRIPVFRQVYTGAKQVMEGLSGTGSINKAAFREVVLVEFPTEGMSTVAFITNEFRDKNGKKMYAIYIPTTPIPSSGFSGIIAEDKVTHTTLSVDEALKMVISGIMIAPTSLKLSAGDWENTLLAAVPPKSEAGDSATESPASHADNRPV